MSFTAHALILTILLCLAPLQQALAADKPKAVERLDIDPALQGIWVATTFSLDGGKTVTHERAVMARARPLSLTLPEGETLNIKKVLVTTNENGNPANILFFEDNPAMFCVNSVKDSPGQFLVQLFVPGDDGKMKEAMRYLMTVSR